MNLRKLNLQMFGDGDGADGGTSDAEAVIPEAASPEKEKGKNPLSDVIYGKQPQQEEEPAESETATDSEEEAPSFEELIKGKYKADFDARVQKIINKRFGDSKKSEEFSKDVSPILDMLGNKYGIDPKDAKAIASALQNDDSYYETEAYEKGMTVKQLKDMKALERENKALKEAKEAASRQQYAQEIDAKWQRETAELSAKYGLKVDFASEVTNPDFVAILKNGGSVETAYKAVHFDDMVGGAMFNTAHAVQQKMANQIQSRAQRPLENGVSSRATSVTKSDVSKLTHKDFEEIERRVARGEVITF